MQFQFWMECLPAIAAEAPVAHGVRGVLQIARSWNSAGDLPDVSKMFLRDRSSHPCQRPPSTLHGVVFDILVRRPVAPFRPVRHEVVTHVLGTWCHLCVRAGQDQLGGRGVMLVVFGQARGGTKSLRARRLAAGGRIEHFFDLRYEVRKSGSDGHPMDDVYRVEGGRAVSASTLRGCPSQPWRRGRIEAVDGPGLASRGWQERIWNSPPHSASA
jgi:hypothetical protein